MPANVDWTPARKRHSLSQHQLSESSDEPRSDDSGQWKRSFNRPMSLNVSYKLLLVIYVILINIV